MIETIQKIEMPSSIDSVRSHIMYLVQLFKNIEKLGITEIHLDFKNTTFFASELYGLYHYMIDELKNKGIKVIGKNVRDNVDYVMHLSEFTNLFNDPSYTSGIQHKDFLDDLNLGNVNCFDNYLKKEFLPKLINNENISSVITSYLSELFVNARTHGQTYKIRCNGQKYNYGKLLKFVIIDFGVTIPFNVSNHVIKNKVNYYNDNDGEAIRWASKEGNTTKIKLGGLGLNDISQFLRKYNSKIKIISRKGYFEVNPIDDKMVNMEEEFKGTMIIVELDLEKISEIQPPKKSNQKFEI